MAPARTQVSVSTIRKHTIRRTHLLLEELEVRTLPSAGLTPVARPAAVTFPFPTGGFTPYQIRHAYGFDAIKFTKGTTVIPGNGAGQTIAVVDPFDDPEIANDLAAFDSAFGLPAPPSFRKVGQTGGPVPTQTDDGWASETSLDVEWAHALAPGANILLVEANSDFLTDLFGGPSSPPRRSAFPWCR
jgi:subtilase family serine protease